MLLIDELDIWKIRFKSRIYFLNLPQIKTIIPSTSLKAKYLRNLPIQTCYLDSNGHKYRVEEQLVRGCLCKVGVA